MNFKKILKILFIILKINLNSNILYIINKEKINFKNNNYINTQNYKYKYNSLLFNNKEKKNYYNNINIKNYKYEYNPLLFNNKDLFSGLILSYFIFKSSNIKENKTINQIINNIILNKKEIFDKNNKNINLNNINNENKHIFQADIINSIVNISLYGMTNKKEFFAEAYSKWLLTSDSKKNKSWEIINNFFINIYPEIQKKYFNIYNKQENIKKIFDFVDEYLKNNNIIYDTKLLNKEKNSLKINNIFSLSTTKMGLEQIINDNIDNEDYEKKINYTFNSIKSGLIKWENNDESDINIQNNPKNIEFRSNIFNKYIINFNNQNLYNNLSKIMNDSYTKASKESIEKFKKYLNSSKEKNYNTYEELNNFLEKNTKLKKEYNKSTIMIDKSMQSMKKYYKWTEKEVNDFKENILNLFNVCISITDENFKYFLGYIFFIEGEITNNNKKNEKEEILGLTGKTKIINDFYNNKDINDNYDENNLLFIIINGKYFNNYNVIYKTYEVQHTSVLSSFNVLFHEFGHAIDFYLNLKDNFKKNLKNYLQIFLDKNKIKNLYKGKIFGYWSNEFNKIEKIILTIFSCFYISLIIFICYKITKKINFNDNKNKNII